MDNPELMRAVDDELKTLKRRMNVILRERDNFRRAYVYLKANLEGGRGGTHTQAQTLIVQAGKIAEGK